MILYSTIRIKLILCQIFLLPDKKAKYVYFKSLNMKEYVEVVRQMVVLWLV